jgi:hypothetical protein
MLSKNSGGEKCMSDEQRAGQIEITVRYLRHVGPMYIHGGVTLQFDSLQPYAFVSKVQWPGADNYENAIRETVEDEMRELQGSLEQTLVVLTEIEWDNVASSEIGFRRAAAAATRAAFDL